ncbi:MAG: hypothetical protein KAU28_04060, partial [Phycisphaerae bacterium]|nr:hypothetical protein [Phycisphaerae bacterium]
GLYVLLARAAEMQPPSEKQFEILPRPGYRNLLKHPYIYRGQAIRMSLRVCTAKKLTAGTGLGASIDWPRGKAAWRLDCVNAATEDPVNEPLMVYCPFDPRELLPKADKVEPDGEMKFTWPGRRIELAGVFYKVYWDYDRGTKGRAPVKRSFPVVVAWQIRTDRWRGPAGPVSLQLVIIIGILVILVAAFLLLRRHLKHTRKSGRRQEYRSLRDLSQSGAAEAGEIDAELTSAVQEYRQERPDDDPEKS